MSFIIGSGYSGKEEQAWLWYNTLRRYAPFPDRIAIISTGPGFPVIAKEIDVVHGTNRGHIGDLYNGKMKQALCGYSSSVMALSLLAYNYGCDLIYLEEDCLAVGSWVEQAYKDLGTADVVFGHKMTTGPYMPCSQSLFIIRHSFLLEFVRRYLALLPDLVMNPENKFVKLEEQDPPRFARLSFGVDRERPIPWDKPVWYAQQLTAKEIQEFKKLGFA